jgi:hypothetical protein
LRKGGGAIFFLFVSFRGAYKEGKHATGGPSSGLNESILFLEIVNFLYFLGMNEKQRWTRGVRSAPFGVLVRLKNTGVRSTRARTRGQNPLVQGPYTERIDLLFEPFSVIEIRRVIE